MNELDLCVHIIMYFYIHRFFVWMFIRIHIRLENVDESLLVVKIKVSFTSLGRERIDTKTVGSWFYGQRSKDIVHTDSDEVVDCGSRGTIQEPPPPTRCTTRGG